MYYSTICNSPLGELTLGSDGKSLIGLWIKEQKYFGEPIQGQMSPQNDLPVFLQTKNWLARYFSGERPSICELSLSPIGGDFRREVWKILCEIPYGEVTTYGVIAKKLAAKMGKQSMSCQAVGGAVGHNPISIIIPCHRVIGANGKLTGYAGGIDKKIRLLTHEGINIENFRLS